MLRVYLIPLLVVASSRGPKYIKWRDNPDGLELAHWAIADYGFEPSAIAVAEVDEYQHGYLCSRPDVYALPEDLDEGATDAAFKQALEDLNIPANWIHSEVSYRAALKRILASLQIHQRVNGILGNYSVFSQGGQWGDHGLSTKIQDLPLPVKGSLFAAFALLPTLGSVQENTTIRGLINRFAWDWKDPIYLGGLEF